MKYSYFLLIGTVTVVILGTMVGIFAGWIFPWIDGVQELSRAQVTVPGVKLTDADEDGLNLAKESAIGTSDNLRDTDNDMLEDNEELIFGTDPLRPDSDKDGYMDGVEVETDHDPLK